MFYPNKEAIDITNKKQDEIARYGVVKTNQIIQDFESLTIKDSLLLAIAAPKYEKIFNFFSEEDLLREAKNEIDEYLDYFHFEDPDNYALSAGEKKLLDIIRCLLLKPKFLLMDEPTRGIDVGSKAHIYNLMNELANQGKAVIFVSSYLPELLAVSDRVAVMSRGRIREIRAAEDWTEETVMAISIRGSEADE